MIENIAINRIIPHPNNPRQNLGDLTELSASIATSGILQNLTVVKSTIKEDDTNWRNNETTAIRQGYTVIIGHRRLAAAKLAGLETVPCAIVEMDEPTQLATMLLENMQRTDLSITEQAQGIQLMLDLGETVATIAEKTGLSQATVRSRKKLIPLDQAKLHQAEQRGGTLSDYAELDKIANINLKNEVLETIGTPNFKWQLQSAMEQEKADKMQLETLTKVQDFALETYMIENENDLVLHQKIRHHSSAYAKFEPPTDIETTQYYYNCDNDGICLYKEKSEETSQIAEDKQEQVETARREELKDLAKQCYNLRMNFAKKVVDRIRHNFPTIEQIASQVFAQELGRMHKETFADFMGIDREQLPYSWELRNSNIPKEEQFESYESASRRILSLDNMTLTQLLFTVTYLRLEDRTSMFFDYNCHHRADNNLMLLYELLCSLDYEMSDEELALQNGTHVLFAST
ncbi:MAG: ParB/RepB/Spo0J family partition protein [Firmicutes bacterium]|nr:ParB/RepB/Spo0J family partition protein [Bacillota bacterium]